MTINSITLTPPQPKQQLQQHLYTMQAEMPYGTHTVDMGHVGLLQPQLPHPNPPPRLHYPQPSTLQQTPSSGHTDHVDFASPASTSYLPTPPPLPPQHHSSGMAYGQLQVAPEWQHMPNAPRAVMGSVGSPAVSPMSNRDGGGGSVMNSSKEGDGRVGVEDPCGERSYSELKVLGDGSFGTVWLVDWHSRLKPDVLLSAMQCGAGARPEWSGKRLVALKRMKRVWDGGWKQARNLGELASLRSIPPHPAVIPLYDAFISPRSRELYFVFECMEGNLYQLTKSRKGRPLAAGLVASCFHQVVTGLHHIHEYGYFHRDMKPENLLVTTTGLCDYLTTSAVNRINAQRSEAASLGENSPLPQLTAESYEKDVQVIVKLADFGLARSITSTPPYTEYVSTRWYRAPEVLLRSTEYGAPVDMWALGTILAEVINLKPLFPGVSEIDQVYRICEALGDPSPSYGTDEHGRPIGGGRWNTGIKLAKNVGFSFPKRPPVDFRRLFPQNTPTSLVDCMADLLRYNPKMRMTSAQCIEHPYFHEILPHLQQVPPLPRIPFSQGQPSSPPRAQAMEAIVPSHQMPPSHSNRQPQPNTFASGDMRTLPPPMDLNTPESMPSSHHTPPYCVKSQNQRSEADVAAESALAHQLRELDLPADELASFGHRRWVDEQALLASGRLPVQYEPMQSTGSISNPSFNSITSQSGLLFSDPNSPAPSQQAFVRQQQAQLSNASINSGDASRLSSQTTTSLPLPPQHPSAQVQAQIETQAKLAAASGKKKKIFGLGSVSFFGGGDKHVGGSASLPILAEPGYQGGSLKRTQSGQPRPSQPTEAPPLDAKTSKKEAQRLEREARDKLARAKREAAERAYQERSRAVMSKRNQMLESSGMKEDLEYMNDTAGFGTVSRGRSSNNPRHRSGLYPPPHGVPSSSSVRSNGSYNSSTHQLSEVLMYPPTHAGHSTGSVRSHGSYQPGTYPLSAEVLASYDNDGGRNKSRKTGEDDDHSSVGRSSMKSRSALTIDSDPGAVPPRRSSQQSSVDPLLQRRADRQPMYRQSGLTSHSLASSASLESQLASQLQRQATVASASESQLSLGRRSGLGVASQLSLDANLDNGHQPHPATHGSRASLHDSQRRLPSIGDWGEVNPMFRVPKSSHPQPQLPPFSTIASMADANPAESHHPHPHQRSR